MTGKGLKRRNVLQAGLFGAAALTLPGCMTSGSAPRSYPPYINRLGIQLYSVRDRFKPDFAGTLEALAAIGYKDVETAGLFQHDPYAVRAKLDELGLVSRSAHVPIDAVQKDLGKLLDISAILGQNNLIVPFVNDAWRSPEGYRKLADVLNEAGAVIAKAGKRIAYHNHDFEFDRLGNGETGYDILLSHTDPDLVSFEADLFWMVKANVDPVAMFKRAPGRFISCHIKDRTASGDMVPVGDGVIDFAALLAEHELAGLDCYYVEHDRPEDSMTFARRSFAALNPAR